MIVRLHPRSGVTSVVLPDGQVVVAGDEVSISKSTFEQVGKRRNGRPLLLDVTPKPTRSLVVVSEPEDEEVGDEPPTDSQEDN